ncbi:hypothetical protein CXB51_010382 [Gossypium anomalum]|uniref:Aminotransferase-like plant mobile domain-containing protein n=1 Tax=Gossypium anomalum TaxID=47600 RepID=A0A8J6D6K6_9ROSI|nr:hypothetical protein CXB51_010382 [Gossypium anomalum]
MTRQLIRLDGKHISVDQMKMVKCTITLEDVQLQLGLPVDRSVITGSAQFAEEPYVTIFWVQFWILFTEVRSICAGYERHFQCLGMIRLKYREYDTLGCTSFRFSKQLVNSTGGLPCCRHCTERCVGRRNQIKSKSEVASHCYNLGLDFAFHFYVVEWNHLLIYGGIPIALEDIRHLLDQQLEAHFQWTPYEDPAIRAMIPDEFLQNPNMWHVRVTLVNYTTVEMHQTNRVLRQFRFRQPIPVAPKVLDDEHKINLR